MQFKQFLKRTSTASIFTLASLAAHATQGTWDSTATPENGFNGLTSTWATTGSAALYAEWNWFTDDSGTTGIQDFTPDVGSAGVSLSHVYETSGAAFLTGGGNIYSFAAPVSITSVLGDASGVSTGTRDVALKIAALGTLPSPLATLNGVNATIVELYSGDSGSGFGGVEKEYLWLWTDVASAPNYTLKFAASESSLSLDQLAIYASPAAAVPEPGSGALMLVGLSMAGVMSRRRRAS